MPLQSIQQDEGNTLQKLIKLNSAVKKLICEECTKLSTIFCEKNRPSTRLPGSVRYQLRVAGSVCFHVASVYYAIQTLSFYRTIKEPNSPVCQFTTPYI